MDSRNKLQPRQLNQSQHPLNQLLRQVVVNAVVTTADGGVDAELGENLLGDLGDFRQDEFDFDLVRKLTAPHFGDEVLAAVTGGLPEAEEAADFVVMQQAVVPRFDLHRPRLVGAEQVLVDAVEIRRAAAFEDEGVSCHWNSLTTDFDCNHSPKRQAAGSIFVQPE